MSLKTRAILVIVIGTIMGLGLSLGKSALDMGERSASNDLNRDQARLIAEVMERVKRDYVEPIDDNVLLESAIRGMVSDLDMHSQFLDAKEFKDIRVSTSGSYSGVGLEVSDRNGEIVVVAPIDGTPAQKAGIQSGDRIIEIDGATIEKEGLRETISRMRGQAGTKVSLMVVRDDDDYPMAFDLRRENIHVHSVRHELIEPSYGYVRVSQFNETTATELSQAIDELIDEAQDREGVMLSGLVLDLRNNPGGILDAAVDVSDLFLDSGTIVSADGRTPEARFTRKAHRGDILDGSSVVVLVNKGSASASEIVAGALQDHERALIVGSPTFGKGLVQTVMPLSRGNAIKLTTSRYFTPSGDSIHGVGISPDVEVEGSRDYPAVSMSARADHENDAQLVEALTQLQGGRVMHSSAQ